MNTDNKYKSLAFLAIMTLPALFSVSALAAVTAEQAAQLGTKLTPMGAEKAGNADSSIPQWTGGLTKADPSSNGGKRGDPFAAEKPLFTITAQNMAQYADKLNDGTKAMLKKYPDSYRLDIYPTHRTAAAPQWVYDYTKKNATSAKLSRDSDGYYPDGAYGGVPFPIPQTGAEVLWNHLLRWRGTSFREDVQHYMITSSGSHVLSTGGVMDSEIPYYTPNGDASFDGNYYFAKMSSDAPAIRAGEGLVARLNLVDSKSGAWTYLPGQRRVRKLPNPCCDTPSAMTAGVMTFDEVDVFTGRNNLFDWKLVGKQELYVPYNSNRTLLPGTVEGVLGEHHLKPEAVRWELHRVWVVEATLADGKRHQMHKSKYYFDEDSWAGLLADRWDANGQLSKTLWNLPIAAPDVPAQVVKSTGFYDLISGAWFVGRLANGKPDQYRIMDRYSADHFTSSSLAGQGVR